MKYKKIFKETFYKGKIKNIFDMYTNPTNSEIVKLIKSAKNNSLDYPRRFRGIADIDNDIIYLFNTELLHYTAKEQIKNLDSYIPFHLNLDTKRIELTASAPGERFTKYDIETLEEFTWVNKNNFKVVLV